MTHNQLHASAVTHAARVAHATLCDLLLDPHTSLSLFSSVDVQRAIDQLATALLPLEHFETSEPDHGHAKKSAARQTPAQPR